MFVQCVCFKLLILAFDNYCFTQHWYPVVYVHMLWWWLLKLTIGTAHLECLSPASTVSPAVYSIQCFCSATLWTSLPDQMRPTSLSAPWSLTLPLTPHSRTVSSERQRCFRRHVCLSAQTRSFRWPWSIILSRPANLWKSRCCIKPSAGIRNNTWSEERAER